jgi:redox-sensing transcriptional repressor
LGVTDAQVRKDFAYFGQFGHPGIGYHCDDLVQKIRKILGTDRLWPVALIGCGNLGQALLGYRGFSQQGFQVVAAFDTDTKIIGRQFQGLEVQDLAKLGDISGAQGIRLAILAVPSSAAKSAVDSVVAAGISGILNFAPVTLDVPKTVSVIGVDLAMELEQLAFAVVEQSQNHS